MNFSNIIFGMSQPLYFEGKKFISSKRASELGSYTQDYIGQLIRSKKIEARMIGRSWFVSEESLLNYQQSFNGEISGRPEIDSEKIKTISGDEIVAIKNPPISPYRPLSYQNDDRQLIPDIKKSFQSLQPRKKVSLKKFFTNPHRLAEIGNKSIAVLLSASLVAGGYFISDAKNATAVFGFLNETGENLNTAIIETFDDLTLFTKTLTIDYVETLMDAGKYSHSGISSAYLGGKAIMNAYDDILSKTGVLAYDAVLDPVGTIRNMEDAIRDMGGTYIAFLYRTGGKLSDSRDFLTEFDLAQFGQNIANQSLAAVSTAASTISNPLNNLNKTFERIAVALYKGINRTFGQKSQKNIASDDGIMLAPVPKISTSTPSRVRIADSSTSTPIVSSNISSTLTKSSSPPRRHRSFLNGCKYNPP